MGITRNGRHTSEETDESSDDEMAFYYGFIEFSEVQDPIEAMMWISHMEDAFKVMTCTDEDKAAYAVSMLRSEALVWWGTIKDTSGLETPTKMTWSRFKEVFKDEFCPVSMELELVQQYKTLEQENIESLQKYTTCFKRLWWFVWDYLTYEKRTIYQYVGGLRPYIKDFISASDMTTFKSTLEAARVIDEEHKRRLQERNGLKKKCVRRMCNNCGKNHEGKCRYGSKGCYQCGEPGHLARECRSYC